MQLCPNDLSMSAEQRRSQVQTAVKETFKPPPPPPWCLVANRAFRKLPMNLRPTTPMLPHWSCEVHLICPGKCTSTVSESQEITKDKGEMTFCGKCCSKHTISFTPVIKIFNHISELFVYPHFLNRLWSPQRKILPSSHSALQGLSTVSYFTQAWIPKAQIFTHMTRLTSSIEQANVACARYLAGRGFIGRLQLLWQLTGAVAGCVTETQRTMNEIHYPVTELLLAFIHCCSNGLVKCQDFKIAHTSTIQSLVERF